MLDFSIIIPIYNSEKTLERCLESIRAQTFLNYEVILIDDGSSDHSLTICRNYALQDPRYHVIHQSNRGPSSARNAGLDIATGNWICFVDSDDHLEAGYLQSILDATHPYEADVVFFGHHKVYGNGRQEAFIPDEVRETKLEMITELSEKDMFGYTWTKSFRRDAVQDIRFDETLNLFEDEVFTCQVIPNCKKVGVVRKPIYNYSIGDGSTLIGRTHKDYCLKCDKVYRVWKAMIVKMGDSQNLIEKKANAFVSRCYYYAFERNIDIREYFSHLKRTLFFQEHTEVTFLDKAVETDNYRRLRFEKIIYQTKAWLSLALHRKG